VSLAGETLGLAGGASADACTSASRGCGAGGIFPSRRCLSRCARRCRSAKVIFLPSSAQFSNNTVYLYYAHLP